MSNPAKHMHRMVLRCLALLNELDPTQTQQLLIDFGFRPGDIYFCKTKATGQPWTEVVRWPWDPR